MAKKKMKVSRASAAEDKAEAEDQEDQEEGGVATKPRSKSKKARAQGEGDLHRFRLLSGTHAEPDYEAEANEDGVYPFKSFKKGDVVLSPNPLDEMFENHFQRLSDTGSTARPFVAQAEEEEDQEDSKGNKIVKGTRAQDNKYPGTKLDRNPADHVFAKTAKSLANLSSDLGDNNVTDSFAMAAEADVAVFENDEGEYFVVERDNPNEAVEEGEKLTKAEVKALLKERVRNQ